jgi:hypothetical protein
MALECPGTLSPIPHKASNPRTITCSRCSAVIIFACPHSLCPRQRSPNYSDHICLMRRWHGRRWWQRSPHAYAPRREHNHRCVSHRLSLEVLTIILFASVQLYSPNGSVLVCFDGTPFLPSHRIVVFAPSDARASYLDHALPPPHSSFVDPNQSILLGGNALPPSGMQSLVWHKIQSLFSLSMHLS